MTTATATKIANVLARLEAMTVADLEYSSSAELTRADIANYLFNINNPSTPNIERADAVASKYMAQAARLKAQATKKSLVMA